MESGFLSGKQVRLGEVDIEQLSAAMARWARDSEYLRLIDTAPAYTRPASQFKKWLEADLEKDNNPQSVFNIFTLEDNRLIGFIGLSSGNEKNGDAWVGIGIGNRDDWGRGYGTEAMDLILKYAFLELNLHRVTLGVFEYNPRAIRSYEKAGFKLEGRERQIYWREGRRWDSLIMGILRQEWEALHLSEEGIPQ